MVFCKFDAEYEFKNSEDRTEEVLTIKQKKKFAAQLCEATESIYQKFCEKAIAVTVRLTDYRVCFAVIADSVEQAEQTFLKYAKLLPFELSDYKSEETGFAVFINMLRDAERMGYVQDRYDILEKFGIGDVNVNQFAEVIINDTKDPYPRESLSRAVFSQSLAPELERIEKVKGHKSIVGHPVHYLVRTDEHNLSSCVCKELITALYANQRIKNKRYACVHYNAYSRYNDESFEALYHLSEGGVVVISYRDSDSEDGEFANRGKAVISWLCAVAEKYRNKVLTVISLDKSAKDIKDTFLSNLENMAFVEIAEDILFGDKAREYLKAKAKEQKIRTDKKLFSTLCEEEKGYSVAELNRTFNLWFDKKIRSDIYPQYKNSVTAANCIKNEKPKGSAYEELHSLIGLESAKSVMENSISFFKAQKIFSQRGITSFQPTMHMVFTGNPGTAKTTVARLFARIMKENGLVENGDIHEVGRADIVGKYVGQTAPLVKEAFKRAKGGVLFIDEAYSLVDDRDGLYGDEAINTIVQEMENHRKDTVVILAGYPDKMEKFLQKNPGLRSRIAFHIPFEDYSSCELCSIAEHIAKEKGLVIEVNAKEKLEGIFDKAREDSDFGNGRYVRNVIEKALMKQAGRLMTMDVERVTDEELMTICAEDIEVPQNTVKENIIKIGFSA